MHALLLASAFCVATCGLVYELLAATLASYVLGDSVTQFSTVIGTYLFAMGIGSWLTRYVSGDLLQRFVRIEILVGLLGGFSALLLFWIFREAAGFRIGLYAVVFVIGTLVGAEIPLLLRALKGTMSLRDSVSRVFAADYIGALLAAVVFPMVLVPRLGLARTAFLTGTINVAVALLLAMRLRRNPGVVALRLGACAALLVLCVGFAVADRAQSAIEAGSYPGQVLYLESTPYQRVVLTSVRGDLQLFLNGNLQFSARDEYRYHEALVHPAMRRAKQSSRVLVLGGGDGLATREVLRYPQVARVDLVDLDRGVTDLFRLTPWLAALNGGSLTSPRVHIQNTDAFSWLQRTHDSYDVVIADFPDPANFSIGKLYTTAFYRALGRILRPGGIAVIQATSPFVAPRSYWCIVSTLEAAGLVATPYHALVPSFGDWGFVLASRDPAGNLQPLPPGLRFLDDRTEAGLFEFPTDVRRVESAPNRLNDQVLVRYFEDEWNRYLQD